MQGSFYLKFINPYFINLFNNGEIERSAGEKFINILYIIAACKNEVKTFIYRVKIIFLRGLSIVDNKHLPYHISFGPSPNPRHTHYFQNL